MIVNNSASMPGLCVGWWWDFYSVADCCGGFEDRGFDGFVGEVVSRRVMLVWNSNLVCVEKSYKIFAVCSCGLRKDVFGGK